MKAIPVIVHTCTAMRYSSPFLRPLMVVPVEMVEELWATTVCEEGGGSSGSELQAMRL